MHSMRYLAVIGVAAAVAITACNAGTPAPQPANGTPWQAPSANDEAAIRELFDSTAAGWNRGDLATYMSPYADSAVGAGAGSFDMGKAAIEQTILSGHRTPDLAAGEPAIGTKAMADALAQRLADPVER